jgi:hypothetical protein
MNDNIVITAANSPYFNSLKTLIASLHRTSYEVVDKIYVFDLGLTKKQREAISKCLKTEVVDLPTNIDSEPKQHVYKPFCVHWGTNLAKNVLWLDAGVMALQSIQEIYNIIESEGIFLVGDKHLNKKFTHDKCIEIMNATKQELNDKQLSSGILGFKSNGNYQQLINEAFHFSTINGCVSGNQQRHRHDQSVYSILASRYNCKRYNILRYGYFTNQDRNLSTARQADAVIFVHRAGHNDFKGLNRIPS